MCVSSLAVAMPHTSIAGVILSRVELPQKQRDPWRKQGLQIELVRAIKICAKDSKRAEPAKVAISLDAPFRLAKLTAQ